MSHVRRLRPYLFTNFRRQSTHASNDYLKRIEHLKSSKSQDEWYPRIVKPHQSILNYNQRFEHLQKDETLSEELSIIGRIQSVRKAGAKLVFVTIQDDNHSVQIVLKHAWESFGTARKGDTFSFTGQPHRTSRGQLSLLATEDPTLLSPSLHQIPDMLTDQETLSHHRHVHMLVDPEVHKVLKIRHAVERTIDDFLNARDFVKVSTPILQAGAGGAVARPFETTATELSGKTLDLRIAPELWLKRLIIGGMSRVYEIGPVFRNEGVDSTHNPEFSICEFYAAHTTLADLMQWTEQLILQISHATNSITLCPSLKSFSQLPFVPTIESKIGTLPDLNDYDAIKAIFAKHDISEPSHPSLPRLLDALAGHFIEPLCNEPTFITHHPAALSPLAKQFRCPQTGQLVSARAELFINHCEIANMYEEQNSPFEQRKAFVEQLAHRAIDGEGDAEDIDHGYLEALEWGLPPTGGWGCGIDRLVMLFAGKSRLSDVLSFGGLRNVVGVGKGK